MCRLVDSLRAQTERYVRVYRFAVERADELGAEHELIFRAARGGDAERVAAAVHEHLALVRDRLIPYVRALRPEEQPPDEDGTLAGEDA